MMIRFSTVLWILLLFQLTACAAPSDIYKREADAFCKLHHPDQWKAHSEKNALENFDLLAERIRGTVKSEAFLELFKRISKQGYADFYATIQPEISKLVGYDWHCENAKAFYTIKWQRAGASEKKIEIEIMVLNNGMYQVLGNKYKATDHAGISKAVNSISKGNKYKILLKIPAGKSKDEINAYLNPFRTMDVKSLSILQYE